SIMPRYKLILEYDGTGLTGWQRQHHAVSVQELLEEAIFRLSGERAECFAAGRTDAGVAAVGQGVGFDLGREVTEREVMHGINFHLAAVSSEQLAVRKNPTAHSSQLTALSAEMMDENFHARFSAKGRSYTYLILNRPARSPILENRVWHIPQNLD